MLGSGIVTLLLAIAFAFWFRILTRKSPLSRANLRAYDLTLSVLALTLMWIALTVWYLARAALAIVGG